MAFGLRMRSAANCTRYSFAFSLFLFATAKVKPPNWAFHPGRKCVETSDDVIEDDFTSTPASRISDFSPMRLGAAKDDFYEVRPYRDKRGVNLISDALPFGRLWYGEPNAIGNA